MDADDYSFGILNLTFSFFFFLFLFRRISAPLRLDKFVYFRTDASLVHLLD